MVAHFAILFVTEYGQTILGGVRARAQNAVDWAWQRDSAGLVVGDDGRSGVLALLDMRRRLNSGDLRRADCCKAALFAIDEGVMVTPVHYSTADELAPVAWNIASHSEEQVQFLSSTVVDHIDLITKLAQAFPVDSRWDDARRWLTSMLGNTRRREVGRWVQMARTLPSSVVEFFRDRVRRLGMNHGIKSSFVLNNQYICAPLGQDTVLPEDLLLTTMQAMFETVDQGIKVTITDFLVTFCEPAMVVKAFRAKTAKKYQQHGASADANSPWQQLVHSLIRDDALRSQVKACLSQGSPLENIPAVKNQLTLFRQSREQEKARQKAEAEAGQQQVRAELDKIREEVQDAARAREVGCQIAPPNPLKMPGGTETRQETQSVFLWGGVSAVFPGPLVLSIPRADVPRVSDSCFCQAFQFLPVGLTFLFPWKVLWLFCPQAEARADVEAMQAQASLREAALAERDAELARAAQHAEEAEDADDLFFLPPVSQPVAECEGDFPQEAVQSEARKLHDAEQRALEVLKGAVTCHESTASLAAILTSRLEQKGAAHSVSVLIDPVLDSPAVEHALADMKKAVPAPGNGAGTVVVAILCGHTVQHVSKASGLLMRELPEAAVFDTKLVSHMHRGVSRYVSCRGLARRGTDEWAVTGVSPPPAATTRPSKKVRRKMSMEIPHVVSDMPFKAAAQDSVNEKCDGTCAYMTRLPPDARDAQIKADQQPAVEAGSLASFKERVARMNDAGESSEGSGEETEPVQPQQPEKKESDDEQKGAKAEEGHPSPACRVFPFARPQAFYVKLFRELLQTRPGHTLLIVQGTGSPNAWMAARDLGITDVHVACIGVSPHQAWHGRSVAHACFRDAILANTNEHHKPDVDAGANLQNKLQYIQAVVKDATDPVDDPWQVAVDPDEPFSGVDVVQQPVAKITERLQDECGRAGVQVRTSTVAPGCQGVFAVNALPEGHVLGAPALFFTRIGFLKAFLQQAGARKYHDRLVVLKGLTRDGEQHDAYAVLLGHAGEIMHSARREGRTREASPPNVVLQAVPRAGFNAGLLQLTVRTFNGCGIAAQGELLMDYGLFFDLALPFGPREAGDCPRMPPHLHSCTCMRIDWGAGWAARMWFIRVRAERVMHAWVHVRVCRMVHVHVCRMHVMHAGVMHAWVRE